MAFLEGMRKGRGILLFALAFVAGDWLGGILTFPPTAYLLAATFLSIFSALLVACRTGSTAVSCQSRAYSFIIAVHLLAACFLGAACCQIGRMPPMPPESALHAAASEARATFSAYLGKILPSGDELAVARALAIGDKGSLTPGLRAIYRDSGAMHLLALSGLHVGIIYGLLSLLFAPLGGHMRMRRLRAATIVSFLWFFAVVSGLSPSILRAVMMITLFEISQFISGRRNGPAALALSAILSTLLNPEAPRQLSFQLSYAAVVGIYLIYPRLRLLLSTGSRLLGYIWNVVCISISCQLTCGVLAFFYFGTFPRYFLITNLLAVPLATAIMYILATAIFCSLLPSGVSHISSFASGTLTAALHLLNSLLKLIAEL